MAYSRRPSRARRAPARRSNSSRSSYRARAVPRRSSYRSRASSARGRRSSSGRQTVRLELVMAPGNEVRTPASVMMKEAPPAKKAKF